MTSLLIISQYFECPINILLAQTKDLYKIQNQSVDSTEKIYLIFFINAFAIWMKCIIYIILFYISIKNVSKLIHRFLLSHQHFVQCQLTDQKTIMIVSLTDHNSSPH